VVQRSMWNGRKEVEDMKDEALVEDEIVEVVEEETEI